MLQSHLTMIVLAPGHPGANHRPGEAVPRRRRSRSLLKRLAGA